MKGIKLFCSELLELKKASDEDFQKNIFSNYSAFVRVFEEMDCMESELMQLKHHVSTQKMLMKNLIDDIYVNISHGETVESVEEPLRAQSPHPSLFECHTNDISENLDTLILERRLDEVVEAVGHAISYCSLLENQKIVLQSCLIKCIRPCMEDILQIHFDHFKKVVSIFT